MATINKQSVGTMLRNAREKNGVELQEICDDTRIRKIFLEAIEADNDNALPIGVYKRLYIKAYCKYLDLDIDEVLKVLDYQGDKNPQTEEAFEIDVDLQKDIFNPSKEIIAAVSGALLVIILLFVFLSGDEPAPAPMIEKVQINELEILALKDTNISVFSGDKLLNDYELKTGDVAFIQMAENLILKSTDIANIQIFADGFEIILQNLEKIDGALKLEEVKILANLQEAKLITENDNSADIKAAFDKALDNNNEK